MSNEPAGQASRASAVGSGPWLSAGPWPVVREYIVWRRLGGWVLRIAALAVGVGYAVYAQQQVAELQHDATIWADPAAIGLQASFEGRIETRMGVFASYSGTVSFPAPGGGVRRERVGFMALTRVDERAPVTVRLVPAAPEQFAFSWAATAIGSRWALVAVIGAIGLVLVPGLLWSAANGFAGQADLAAAVGVDGEQQVLRCVRVAVERARWPSRHTDVAEAMTPAGAKQVAVRFRTRVGGACRVLPDGVLAVTSPTVPGRVLLLREDFWPLALAPADAATARARIAAHNDRVRGDAAAGGQTRGHGDAPAS